MSTFEGLDTRLQGRNRESLKVANHTYLKRRGPDKIAVKLHDTDVLTFHKNGQIDLCNGGYPTSTTHERMNNFLPTGYRVFGEPMQSRSSNGGMSVLFHFVGIDVAFHYERIIKQECLIDNYATILPDGTLQGTDPAEYRKERREERNAENRERNRERRWVARARGVFIDHANCAARKAGKRWECGAQGRWNRRNNETLAQGETEKTLECGCLVYREVAKPGKLTVSDIVKESNAAVRAAQIQIYGVERFFLDCNPTVIDTLGDYALVELKFGVSDHVRALKMTCPSTSAVYINPLPPHTSTIPAALDWIFQVEDYLGQLRQEA